MELHQLRCFVAAAEELHFGKAARRLDMLPSALGRQIRMLEEELGTQLLLRTTRHVMLAQDGAWNGAQVVPRQWIIDATTADPVFPHLSPRLSRS